MVVAHAVIAAEAGDDVIVDVDDDDDDGGGCRAATLEARRLQRMCDTGHSVGSIGLVDTITVLERAAGGEYLPDRDAMRTINMRLRNRR